MTGVIDYFLALQHISALGVLVVGMASFFTPCVLPLVFSYLTFISGVSYDELTSERKGLRILAKVVVNTIFFIAGFSAVFLIVGGLAGALGDLIKLYQPVIYTVSAVLVIILALHIAGLFKIKFLMTERRIQVKNRFFGPIGSFVVGFTFAFAMSPCLSGIVIAVIPLAVKEQSFWGGVRTMGIFSIGLGLPFLLTSLFVNAAMNVFAKMRKHYRKVEVASALILILLAGYLALLGVRAMQQLKFEDLNGRLVLQSEFYGKPTLMIFFASYCEPCIREVPEVNAIHEKYGRDRLNVVGVNWGEDADAARGFIAEHHVRYRVIISDKGSLAAAGGQALPYLILFDKNGRSLMTASSKPDREALLKKVPEIL